MLSATSIATSKRRRTSMSSSASVASREDDSGSVDLDYQPETKRKKTIRLDPIEQCQQLYDLIRNHKKEDGAVLCEAFIRVPKRRQEPAYYEVVSNPMDMIRIQQKIKMDEYDDIEQMSADVDLMVANAKAFYKRNSQEYKDACDLWDYFIESKCRLFDRDSPTEDSDRKGKITIKLGKLARRAAAVESRKPTIGEDGETSESSSTTTDRHDDLDRGDNIIFDNLEELFSAVMVAKDVDDRPLHTVFQLLPSRRQYPNYYEIIENPIDLKMIASKIQGGEYTDLSGLERDMISMFRNACTFNEPGSQIYKDAKTLKRIVNQKRTDLEHRKQAGPAPGKTSERIRNRRLRSGYSHSAITAALQYEDESEEEEVPEIEEEEMEIDEEEVEEEEEDGEEENYDGDREDPMWLLFEHIGNFTNSTGTILSDPFRRLPSRRYYPDYYKEIRNPIALSQIRSKLNRGEYENVTQVQADMNIMFENAKLYNRPDSSLYKTACKLQKAMQHKVQDLLDQDDSSNDAEGAPVKRNINTTPLPTLVMEGPAEPLPQTIVPDKPPGLEIAAPPPIPVVVTPPAVTSPAKSQSTSPKKVKTTKRESGGSGNLGLTVSTKSNPHKGMEKEDPKAAAIRDEIKKRLRLLYATLVDYQQPDGRCPISLFMEKPSKKQYPDYYRVIVEPIDMLTIRSRIDSESYNGTDEIIKDLRLMFNNCRQYNEEGSLIYEDANKLEQVLNDKLRVIGPDPSLKPKKKKKRNPALLQKQKRLLETIKEYRDKNGRQLSTIFQKLPSKAEYPEYYEVIKSPIDLEKICNKQRNGTYESLDHIANDFMLMFDNACKFNEPDSQIYKDALVLQRLLLQTKLTISSEDGIPDVPCSVREILTSIFTSVYNHQDEEGRCYSDTMAELPEFDEMDGQKRRAISLDLIKNRLDRGFYKRLDVFQRDMFLCFERARKLSRTDSQLFEDSIELHSFFVRVRDESCAKGQVLQSPALEFTLTDLEETVQTLRIEKRAKETPQEEDLGAVEIKTEDPSANPSAQLTECYNDQVYCLGDFVYVGPSYVAEPSSDGGNGNNKPQPNIANIQKLWTAPDGTKMFDGIWFFRPDQTYHLPTRKFLQKEVFRSEVRSTAMLSEIVGKCYVMTVKGKEYFNFAPEGFADDDVYVCEYRYSSRGRSFTKLKAWPFGSDRIKMTPRSKPLEPIRVASVFSERVLNHKEEFSRIEDELDKMPAEAFPNIRSPIIAMPGREDQTFYEQYNLPCCGPVRMGDYVFVRVENGKKLVARIDSMWTDNVGTAYFHGPWFTTIAEVSPSSIAPGRTFYQQEIFQSSIEDTNPLLSVCGKCCVLDVDDYKKRRPTEIAEKDVYVCESLYDEARREIRIFEGLKKIYCKDLAVHRDEVYFFRTPITMTRVDSEGTVIVVLPAKKITTKATPMSPAIMPKIDGDHHTEDSMDFSTVGSQDAHGTTPVVSTPIQTPVQTTPVVKKAKTPGKKLVTGYILYSSEVRKLVAEKNPDKGFGEISRMVGNDWRKMCTEDKQKYEERAQKINKAKEAAARQAEADAKAAEEASAAAAAVAAVAAVVAQSANTEPPSPSSTPVPAPSPSPGMTPGILGKGKEASKDTDMVSATAALKKDPDWIFECCWDNCDWQFEDALDLIEHCIQEPKGHVSTYFKDQNQTEFQCHWKNCSRVKKGVNPFPTLVRILRHVKDIHIMKGNGRIIHPDMRSKKCMPSSSKTAAVIKAKSMVPSVVAPLAHIGGVQLHNSSFLMPPNSPALITTSGAAIQQVPQAPVRPAPPPEPLFVAVPPRPQKLLHSEAYIRYIESLHAKKRKMTDWDKTLNATQENTKVPDESKLPKHWLANGAGSHGTVTNALWALRDFMMRDALNLSKVNK